VAESKWYQKFSAVLRLLVEIAVNLVGVPAKPQPPEYKSIVTTPSSLVLPRNQKMLSLM